MEMYNPTTDILIDHIRPVFINGMVSHYKALNVDTNKVMKISLDDLKENYSSSYYIDIDYLRGNDDMDDFMRKTMG